MVRGRETNKKKQKVENREPVNSRCRLPGSVICKRAGSDVPEVFFRIVGQQTMLCQPLTPEMPLRECDPQPDMETIKEGVAANAFLQGCNPKSPQTL